MPHTRNIKRRRITKWKEESEKNKDIEKAPTRCIQNYACRSFYKFAAADLALTQCQDFVTA